MADFDRSSGPPPPSGSAVFLQVGLGVALVFLLHFVVGLVLTGVPAALSVFADGPGALGLVVGLLFQVQTAWMLGLSIAQLAYVLPVALALAFVRRAIALGMVIGAALTFVLQGACYVVVGVTVLGLYGQL